METQIPRTTQNARFDRLLALQEGIALSKNEPMLGKKTRVLCDGPSKTDKGMLSGRNSENKIVFFPDDGTPQGEFVDIEIDRVAPFALYGKHV